MLFANVCVGFIRFCYGVCGDRCILGSLGAPRVSVYKEGAGLASVSPSCPQSLAYAGVPIAGHAVIVGRIAMEESVVTTSIVLTIGCCHIC